MDQTISVEVGEDHLAAFRRSPKAGIAELIWNALDADATEVVIEYELNALEGIAAVIVRDNGAGMTSADATLEERVRRRLTVTGSGATLRNVRVSVEDDATDAPTGTVVRIDQLTDKAQRELLRDGIWEDLTTRFAPYLEQYPDVSITYRGRSLDAKKLRARVDTSTIQVDGTDTEATLTIIEWTIKVDRRLYLCDENGSALVDVPAGVQAPGYQFTAYLRWSGFQDIGHYIVLAEMDDDASAGKLVSTAKERIRYYFRERTAELQIEQIRQWEDDGIYPDFGDSASPAKVAERQAFDLIALAAAPIVNEGPRRTRKLALTLIKTALESGPTALQEVLLNVLELPQEKVEELQVLLGRTTLSSVIEASKRIADRLDFLSGLDGLIFDADSKKQTLERRQLHRILANETWVFGEEWALTGDDDRLTQVLAAHLHLLGEDVDLAAVEPVLREDGRDAIPDLVLSRTLETAENKYEHLVIELKRPSHQLNSADIEQLRSYAVAVATDDRFQQPNVRWTYVLIGNSTNVSVDEQRTQLDLPYGRVQNAKRYSLWVRTWAEVIGDAKHRHKFLQRSLDYTTDHDSGVEYLRQKHRQYLPGAMMPAGGSPLPASV